MIISDLDIRKKRKCIQSFISLAEQTDEEILEHILRETMAYTFYKVSTTGDFTELKKIDKYFLLSKQEVENSGIKRNKAEEKELEELIQNLFKNIEQGVNVNTLKLKELDIDEVFGSLILELDMHKILKAALGSRPELKDRVSKVKPNDFKIKMKLPAIIKSKTGVHTPIMFFYPTDLEDPELDPLINLVHMYFLITKQEVKQMIIIDIKNMKRVVLETPKLNQMEFLREMLEFYLGLKEYRVLLQKISQISIMLKTYINQGEFYAKFI